jgi:hypothetical protein
MLEELSTKDRIVMLAILAGAYLHWIQGVV